MIFRFTEDLQNIYMAVLFLFHEKCYNELVRKETLYAVNLCTLSVRTRNQKLT